MAIKRNDIVQYTNKKSEFNNQGHYEYLHESKHLCGYVVTVLNVYIIILQLS